MNELYSNNADLLAALCILAPEDNVRTALVGLIEFLEGAEEGIVFDRRAIFECVAQGIVYGFDPKEWTVIKDGEPEDFSGKSLDQIVAEFKQQLDIEEE